MSDFRPRSEINNIDFKNGKCLISHSPSASLLILRPEDIEHVAFMLHNGGPQFVERNIGERVVRLSVTQAIMQQIKAMTPTN